MKPLVIDNFQKKVNKTYLQEFAKMKNVDCNTVAGVAMVNYKLENDNDSYDASSFTADAGTDQLTTPAAHGLAGLVPVLLTTTGVLPAGLSLNTVYYVIPTGTTTLQLANSIYNALSNIKIDLSDAGTGTHTITQITLNYATKIVDRASNDAYFNLFAVDNAGRIWTKYLDGVWTIITGNVETGGSEIIVWEDYLFVLGNSSIDVYGKLSGILTGTATWTTGWQTLPSGTTHHPAIVGQDNVVYVGSNKYVTSIEKAAGETFAPANAASYSYTSEALDLPDNYQVTCLAELSNYLAIGTQYGYGLGAGNIADVFLWDRVDLTFELPIRLGTQGVRALLNYNGTLYIFAGIKGKIYATNGTDVSLAGDISAQMLDLQQEFLQVTITRNSVARQGDKIVFGMTTTGNGYPVGIFSFSPETGGIAMEQTISTGSDGSASQVNIHSIYADTDNILYVAWEDDTSYGIDRTSISRRYTSETYILTGLYRVGTKRRKRTFKNCEINLAKALAVDNSVSVYYREKLDENFTKFIGTIDSGFSTVIEKAVSVESVQLKIELVTSANNNYTPELVSVILN